MKKRELHERVASVTVFMCLVTVLGAIPISFSFSALEYMLAFMGLFFLSFILSCMLLLDMDCDIEGDGLGKPDCFELRVSYKNNSNNYNSGWTDYKKIT